MLDDLRILFRLAWRRRARVYASSAGALALCMTAIRFNPTEQSESAAALWLGFAIGVVALVTRARVAADPRALRPQLPESAAESQPTFVPADVALGQPPEPAWVKSLRG